LGNYFGLDSGCAVTTLLRSNRNIELALRTLFGGRGGCRSGSFALQPVDLLDQHEDRECHDHEVHDRVEEHSVAQYHRPS